ncbi:hypothetical protein [Mucilaginibacter pocheonensis]|uniref:Lipoprotein n=1 Tax=Mucilaginibacter pocheonensis TaxID=398050 RepID=A0ABU1TES0_9SPHI|nr:hypothetical protein [Mucilaginibacter pocheonensis]MDR6943896.1 hypothetical protein [Mucilaginibacter pocheonensis]
MKIIQMIMIIGISVFIVFSCGDKNYRITPEEFKNRVEVDKKVYLKDKEQIYQIIQKMINDKTEPFDAPKEYDQNTQIMVDTIIYNQDQNRLITFIINKNSTDKLLKKENKERYYYNSNYFFCLKDTQGKIKIFEFSNFNLKYFYNLHEIKNALYNYCFISYPAKVNKAIFIITSMILDFGGRKILNGL